MPHSEFNNKMIGESSFEASTISDIKQEPVHDFL